MIPSQLGIVTSEMIISGCLACTNSSASIPSLASKTIYFFRKFSHRKQRSSTLSSATSMIGLSSSAAEGSISVFIASTCGILASVASEHTVAAVPSKTMSSSIRTSPWGRLIRNTVLKSAGSWAILLSTVSFPPCRCMIERQSAKPIPPLVADRPFALA
ncbi:hypothetical protein D3C81_1468270 [compost metagenome]